MEWHLDGPAGPTTIAASTPDDAVEKYGNVNQLEDYELSLVVVTPAQAFV